MIIQFSETGGKILNQHNEQLSNSALSSESTNDPGPTAPKGQYFEIRIKSQLSDIWADWFEGLTVAYLDNGEMLLSGYIVDQSALMGILNKLVRLNLTLLSVNEIKQQKEKK